MKTFYFLFSIAILLTSCSSELISPSSNQIDVAKTLWEYADENYVYFDYKSIDWDLIKVDFLNNVGNDISEDSLFVVCSEIIGELKDGHNFLNDGETTYKYDYASGFDTNFSLDLIESKYLENEFQTEGFFTYGIINDTIGYVYYEKFNSGALFKDVMQFFTNQGVLKIIIDIRNNSGGTPETAQNITGYFVNEPTLVGYMTHKAGKGHNDFSNKIEINALPKSFYFNERVNILINRKSFSASSYFAGMMTHLPNVKLIGQTTGGGGGAAAAFELPNGWVVGITSNFFLDSHDNHIENGVTPTIEVENSALDISSQLDKMLEKAIEN